MQTRARRETERRTRAIDRYAYAPDASHFQLVPQEVVVAADAADVGLLMRDAAATGRPITFRSGGTSLSGQAVSDATLIDVRKHFRAIKVLDGGAVVRSGPGATVRQVNAVLARHRRKIGPDPASEIACTIGGVVADNSSGMSCGTAGNSYSTLEALTVVLTSGTVVDSSLPDANERLAREEPGLVAGLLQLRDRVRADPASVETVRRLFAMKNTMGYGVNAFLDFEDPVGILTHLAVGSEGTLGFVASATFRTLPVLPFMATALAVFDDIDAATNVLPALVATDAAALELMDDSSLRVGAADPTSPAVVRALTVDRQSALLVEYHAESPERLAELVERGTAVLRAAGVADVDFASDAAERAELWHLRKGLYATVAGARPPGTTALLEDVVVPVAALSATCAGIQRLLAAHGYPEGVIFGHAKDGNVHFMLTDDFSADGALARFAAFTEDLVDLILEQHGSLKAEHGTGRMMAPFVRRQYGDELYEVMREVKRLFDPAGLLNPGVIIADDADIHLQHIGWTPPIELEADRCVECGYCESSCPSRDITLTPRQRIVVRRAMERARRAGDFALLAELERDYTYDGVQTCAVDGMCQTACPVLINTGDLIKRLRVDEHAAVERQGWKAAAGAWSAATAIGSAALTVTAHLPAPVVLVPNTAARKVLGDDVVPLWSKELPGGGPRRGRPLKPGVSPVAAYLPACVNAMFGPDEGPGVQVAFETLCERAGVEVAVVQGADALCCGTPWTSKGLPAGHRRMESKVVDAVRRATGDGAIPLVCDASSCTEGLRHMIAEALPHVAVVDIVQFTATELLPRLPDAKKLGTIVLHPTCSSTRMGLNLDLMTVAGAVADTVDVPVDWGCCAFAGDRGMLHPELTASATARQAAEIREIAADAHASCNRTCELGMTRATGETYRHVIELLAEAELA